MTTRLSIEEVEYLGHRLAKEIMDFDEPIPDFNTRFPNILESCVATPFATYSRKDLYSGLIAKAAVLFYCMIKNHPFQNGNKRIAVTTLFVFLHKNKKWLKVDSQELYNFAIWVAESASFYRDDVLIIITKFIKKSLTDAK